MSEPEEDLFRSVPESETEKACARVMERNYYLFNLSNCSVVFKL